MTTRNQRLAIVAAQERESALEVLRERKAELDPRVGTDVKAAAKRLAERYEYDLRELAKR